MRVVLAGTLSKRSTSNSQASARCNQPLTSLETSSAANSSNVTLSCKELCQALAKASQGVCGCALQWEGECTNQSKVHDVHVHIHS